MREVRHSEKQAEVSIEKTRIDICIRVQYVHISCLDTKVPVTQLILHQLLRFLNLCQTTFPFPAKDVHHQKLKRNFIYTAKLGYSSTAEGCIVSFFFYRKKKKSVMVMFGEHLIFSRLDLIRREPIFIR